ncbi:hypothetical protein D8674_037906 [Pyrus ussuriensis x Pyrus communis]|uniref:Uncharacterized protein n=1 Tax=Pyrus ussuriensis x Pyrus communis TaxID=2448454 RepID=A0A5N5GX99_9ROSA|nr:hypothetical protein D8674_037906 [Pyrus ussuriensis x Pyrus communis]
MADSGGPSSKTIQGEGSEKDMANKFRGNVGVLPDWNIDKSDSNLMKCINVVFKYHFRELKFDVQRDAEQHGMAGPADD